MQWCNSMDVLHVWRSLILHCIVALHCIIQCFEKSLARGTNVGRAGPGRGCNSCRQKTGTDILASNTGDMVNKKEKANYFAGLKVTINTVILKCGGYSPPVLGRTERFFFLINTGNIQDGPNIHIKTVSYFLHVAKGSYHCSYCWV